MEIALPSAARQRRYSLLCLLSLAESTLPIGGLAHSFGLETAVMSGLVTSANLGAYLSTWVTESLRLEGAYALALSREVGRLPLRQWRDWNAELSAWKPARESREASLRLGGRLWRLGAGLLARTAPMTGDPPSAAEDIPSLTGPAREATASVNHVALSPAFLTAVAAGDAHHCLVFSLLAHLFAIPDEHMLLGYLNQTVTSLLSAAQRLMPLGQVAATTLLWDSKAQLIALTAELLAMPSTAHPAASVTSFMPLADIAAMQHEWLEQRMFLS